MPQHYQDELTNEIQRLIKLLNMGSSVYNIETRVGKDGKAYIMELTPRGGGNRLCEMLHYATGIDLIKNAVKAAVGMKDFNVCQSPYKGNWAEVILHGDKTGIFNGLDISSDVEPYVVERDLWIKEGDKIENFNGANDAIGTLVLNFDSQKQLVDKMNHQSDWLKINIIPC
jgi:hypothetical protein